MFPPLVKGKTWDIVAEKANPTLKFYRTTVFFLFFYSYNFLYYRPIHVTNEHMVLKYKYLCVDCVKSPSECRNT